MRRMHLLPMGTKNNSIMKLDICNVVKVEKLVIK